MTEYTTSSEAVREYLSSRERTEYWLERQAMRNDDVLLSPSSPPSIIEDYGPYDSDDDSYSDRSIPPRMILRWNDGRPDIPIGGAGYSRPRAHSQPVRDYSFSPVHGMPPTVHPSYRQARGPHPQYVPQNPSHHSRHAQTLSYASGPLAGPPQQFDTPAPPSPEHIVILPSPQDENGPPVPSAVPVTPSNTTHRPPMHSHSRTPTAHLGQPEQIIPTGIAPSYQSSRHPNLHAPSPRHAINPSQLSRDATQSPQLVQSHSHPPATNGSRFREHPSRPGTQLPYDYTPPAIIYAPSSRQGSTRYAPPAIVYSPPSHSHHSRSRGPAQPIVYSHSDPLPQTHNGHYATLPRRPHTRGVLIEEDSDDPDRDPSRSRSHGRGHARSTSTRGRSGGMIPISRSPPRSHSVTPPLSDAGSRTSGSTYYILPTPGQKVQIIDPSAPSIRTATSVTKASQHSPHSPSSAGHKNLFQRIFSIPKFAGSVDSRGSSGSWTGRKLQRRHTVTVGSHGRSAHSHEA